MLLPHLLTPQLEGYIYQDIKDRLTLLIGGERATATMTEIRDCKRVTDRLDFYLAFNNDLERIAKTQIINFNETSKIEKKYKEGYPVTPKEFLLEDYYLGKQEQVYPKLIPIFEEMNCGQYQEALLTGAIGTAKSTLAIWTICYQLYLLSCYTDPHAIFGLDKSSEIMFVFQSLTGAHAKGVDFTRFKSDIERCPYFREKFPHDPNLTSELQFPNRIIVKPISGADTGAIGMNVFGGMLDEVNYMQVVEKSKQSIDQGTYDQAIALYNSISRRRKSRFMNKGAVPGIFCIVSSKRYPGQFTDKKEEEAIKEKKEKGYTTIYVYDKRTWDIFPDDKFSGNWFNVFVGDSNRKPRILGDKEKMLTRDQKLILAVPEEYRPDFETDPINALREIGGVSTLARHPYMMDTESIAKCFGTYKSVLSTNDVDFSLSTVKVYPTRFINPDAPRYAHIDLAKSGDSAGVVVGYVDKFIELERAPGLIEKLPLINIDCTLRVNPPKGGEINFEKIRAVLYVLRSQGLNIKWVSFDSFQSTDSIQILRQRGFVSGLVSMDTDTKPYAVLKTALYDTRVKIPTHELLKQELLGLEYDPKKNKIDHPPTKSKDVSDALAGVVYGLTMRREVWAMHGISPFEIPSSLKDHVAKNADKLKEVA
jgi:hypothetical protein